MGPTARTSSRPITAPSCVERKRGARDPKGATGCAHAPPVRHPRSSAGSRRAATSASWRPRPCTLLDLYGADILGAAAREAIARGTHDPGALAVLCEERRRAADEPVPIDIDLGAHVPDRDVIPHDLETYDAQRRHR